MQESKSTYASRPAMDPFQRLSQQEIDRIEKGKTHVFGNDIRCKTDTIGYPTPGNRSPLEIVVDATEGFIPLWDENTTLHWRFQEQSLTHFVDAAAAKTAVRELFGEAILIWGDAPPVKFTERRELWDFEIVIRESDDCDINGCVLASAFFPDGGRHELSIYPRTFQETPKEQIDTLAHELGHIFGLRHFFARISESAWPSEVFGKHTPFSIMNYGAQSEMTPNDRADLQRLYQVAWSGQLTHINGTPIRLVRPFHTI
jgi:hypothetical protein